MKATPTFFVVRAWWLTAAALVCVGTIAYWNSFYGVFVDEQDYRDVRDNQWIMELVPLRAALGWPAGGEQSPLAGRPALSLSYALNYALQGEEPWGYHLVNVLLHIGAGILLFGILWRTLESESVPLEVSRSALPMAGVSVLLWLVHPVQTAAVTHISQRPVVFAGLCMLAALYCAISGQGSTRRRVWHVLAVVACVLAVGVQPQAAVIPLVILVHDAVFNDMRYRDVVRERWALYAGLAACWPVAAWLQWSGRGASGAAAETIRVWQWVLMQVEILMHYLRLMVVPYPLIHHYQWPVVESVRAVAAELIAAGVLSGWIIWAVMRRRWYGFAGVWIVGLLAAQVAGVPRTCVLAVQEARMYLAVAGVIVMGVVGIRWAAQVADRYLESTDGWLIIPSVSVVSVLVMYLTLTIDRNELYRSVARLTYDSALKQPQNEQLLMKAAELFKQEKDYTHAAACYRELAAHEPADTVQRLQIGEAFAELGYYADALTNWYAGAELTRDNTVFFLRIAEVQLASGETNAARVTYMRILARDAGNGVARRQVQALTQRSAPTPQRERHDLPRRPAQKEQAPWQRRN